MNPELAKLNSYPFEKLKELLCNIDIDTKKSAISMAIGEPKHQTPKFIIESQPLHQEEMQINYSKYLEKK